MDAQHFEPQILAYRCKYCAYAAADLAGSMRLTYPPDVKIIQLPCSGRVDTLHLLKAIENGADGVYVAGCLEGECHFVEGNLKTRKKWRLSRRFSRRPGSNRSGWRCSICRRPWVPVLPKSLRR